MVPGRHYGFPPRHEAYLPGVIDEPPIRIKLRLIAEEQGAEK
jgi:hypothetical protein